MCSFTDYTKIIKKYSNTIKKRDEEIASLKKIIALMPGNVYWLNNKGKCLACNENLLNVMGLKSYKDILGKTPYLFMSKDIAKLTRKNNDIVIKTAKDSKFEEIGADQNGKQITYLTHKIPLKNAAGAVTGLLGISIDISALKQTEEELKKALCKAEAANQAKTAFLENMRHDIRTPLSGIIGFANLLKNDADKPDKIREYSDNLITSSNTLLDFLNEILESIKATSGELPVTKQPFDFKNKLEEILKLNQAKIAEKKLKISLSYDKKIPRYCMGDGLRIQRIFLELVSNAIKFTNTGTIKCTIKIFQKKNCNFIIKLAVQDTGIGIPKDKQEEIFTKFKRLTPSFQGIYKGTGLGLSIVKQFIDDLHGEIYVDSVVNKGSIFTCLIPLQGAVLHDDYDSIVQKKIKNKKYIPKLVKNKKKSNILLVEDDTFVAYITKNILCDLGCNVDVAATGKEAIKLAGTQTYDIIFMDIGLPDIDGYEVTKQIRSIEPTNHHIPIITLSAHSSFENTKECVAKGMNAVLTKPLMKDTAKDVLDRFIPGRSSVIVSRTVNKNTLNEITGEIINLKVLKIEMGDTAKSILEIASRTLPVSQKLAERAYKEKNWSLLKSCAHKIRGGSAYCHAERLRDSFGALDDYLLNKHDQKIISFLFEQATKELNLFLEQLPAIIQEIQLIPSPTCNLT